jgi:HEAT repeat protein
LIALSENSVQYDFIEDLGHAEAAVVYAAAKALGHLPELRASSVLALKRIAASNDDYRIRLEAAASLARLNDPNGLNYIKDATARSNQKEIRMEAALILGEFEGEDALNLLAAIAADRSNDAELRAAAAWGMPGNGREIIGSSLLDLLADADENVALHSIVAASRLIRDDRLDDLLEMLGQDARQSAGIARAILASSCEFVPSVVERLRNATGSHRQWLLYLIALRGRGACEMYLRDHLPQIVDEVAFFWDYHLQNWTARLDVADQTEFLLSQVLE